MQYTLIKESESFLKTVSYSVPQGCLLGPLSFILFNNDMHNSVEYCKVHHYADDINLPLTNSSLKKFYIQENRDLSLICHWLRANKINDRKTEIIIFSPKN